MDASRFDRMTRALAALRSRRRMLAVLATGTVRLAAGDRTARAGPGCRNVGRRCRRSRQCCSGICKGKKGDKRCKAHDTGGCPAGIHPSGCGGNTVFCTTSAGTPGVCTTTTGNAGYCIGSGLICTPCQKDADCRSFCGKPAACIRCPGCGTVDTACVGPVECD